MGGRCTPRYERKSASEKKVVAAAPTATRKRTRSRTARDGLRRPCRASVMSAAASSPNT